MAHIAPCIIDFIFLKHFLVISISLFVYRIFVANNLSIFFLKLSLILAFRTTFPLVSQISEYTDEIRYIIFEYLLRSVE